MSNVFRANRKAHDADIIRMNSVGLSLATIARELHVHPTTISLRLKSLKITPADTRRTFMEDVFMSLSLDQRDFLADQLGPHIDVKTYVRNLIVKEHTNYLITSKARQVSTPGANHANDGII